MSRAGITVSIKGEINDLEAKITQSKEIINDATKQIIAENNKLKASQDAITNAQKTYANEIANAKDEVKKYIEIKSQNGKLTKDEQKKLAAARAELALYKIKTSELVDVEKQRQQEIRRTINATKELSNLQRASIADSRLEIDTKRKIIAAENEVATSKNNSEKSTSNLANTTIRYLRWAGTIAGVVYAGKRAWDLTAGSGIAVNKIIENNTYGIAALISANTQMVDSLGKTLTPIEKFTKGQEHAKKIIAELRTESTKTAATFPQLLEIFQQGIGKTLSMGDAFGATTEEIEKNTIKLASRMSNFANAIGMPMDRVKEEMRSLVSGNASTDSLISTIIFGSPGEANKAIKEAENKVNGVADLLNKKFTPFDILAETKTFDKSVLAVQDSWSRAMGDMVEKSGAFKDITNIFYDMSKDITENTDSIVKGFDNLYKTLKTVYEMTDDIAAIAGVAFGAGGLIYGVTRASTAIAALDTVAISFSGTMAGLLTMIKNVRLGLVGLAAAAGTLIFADEIEAFINNIKKITPGWKDELEDVAKVTKKELTPAYKEYLSLLEKQQNLQRIIEVNKNKNTDRAKEELELTNKKLNLAKATFEEEKKTIEQVATFNKDLKQAGELIANPVFDTERMKEDEKELLNLQGNIAKFKDEIIKKEKLRAELSKKLTEQEKAQAEAVKRNKVENPYIATNIATYKKDIEAQDKLIAENKRKLSEEEQKNADEALRKSETKLAKEKEQNKQLAEQSAIRAEIQMYLSGNIDTEQLAIEQQRIKIAGLHEEYAKLTDKALQEKVLLEILKEQYSYNDKIVKAAEKEQKQYKFDQISGSVKYGSMENLGQIYQELLVYYKEDPESLADLQTWVEREQNKLSKKPLVIDIKLQGWDEVSNSIATFGNNFQDINKAQKKYQQENAKVIKDEVALNQARVDLRDTTMSGIADMTGAISNFYDEDDDRRKKQLELQKVFFGAKMAMQVAELAQSTAFTSLFVAQEAAKGATAGATAVAVAAQSSPWTGFATAAAMAALLASFGIMIGGKTKTSTTSDAFSSQVANTGTGSVLGDTAAQSESIVNALAILEDFASPQYQTLQSMNKYLANISNNISGVSSLLIQSGGFAFGEGYSGFDTGYKNNIGLNTSAAGLLGGAGAIAGMGLLGTGFGAMGALSVLGPAGLAVAAVDKLLLGGALTNTIGGIVNSVLGGIFGKKSVSQALTDSGIYFADTLLTTAIEQFNGQSYQTISTTVKKKSWFGSSSSTSVASYFDELDSETERQFSLVLDDLYNTALTAGEALDSASSDTAKSLDNFVVSIGKISLKDKTGSEIQDALKSIFGEIGDDIAKTAFPLLTGFQQIGEGLFSTLTRVSTGMEQAEYYIGRLGKSFQDISYTDILNTQGDVGFEALLQSIIKTDEAVYGLDNNLVNIIGNLDSTAEELYGVYTALDELRDKLIFIGQSAQGLSSSMIYGAGSAEALAEGFSAFFENFLDENEQLTYGTQQLIQNFNDLGIALPASKDSFKALLKGIDLTTVAGQELYGRLIVLSEGFSNVAEETKKSIETLQESLDTQKDTYKKVIYGISEIGDTFLSTIDSISAAIDTLLGNKTGANKTEQSIQNYFSTKSRVEALLSKGSNLTTSESKELNNLTNELSSLATGIQSGYADNTVATNELVSDLTDINARLDFSNEILQVNIVDGLSDMLGLSKTQAEQLKYLLADTKLTNTELNSIAGLTQIQKNGIVEFANNSNYFSTEGTLSSLEEYSRLQLEALKQTQANESESLSSKTLSYGDYIGKQEQIDIATKLGVSYDTAKPLIEQIRALSVSKNQTADIAKMVGFNGEDFTNQTAVSQMKALAQYSNVDILGTIEYLSTTGQQTKLTRLAQELEAKNKLNAEISVLQEVFNKEKAESDIAKAYYDSQWHSVSSGDNGARQIEDFASGTPYAIQSPPYINEKNVPAWQQHIANVYNPYLTQFGEAKQAYSLLQSKLQEKSLKGFKVGGYTGNGPVDEIAGYTHRKEFVVNAPDLQAIGGPDELRNMIQREKRSRTTINSNIGNSNSKDDIIQQLGNQVNILEKGFNIMINKLSDLVDFNEERKANNFPVTASGTVTAIGA